MKTMRLLALVLLGSLCACVEGLDEDELVDLLLLENLSNSQTTPGSNGGSVTTLTIQDNADGSITLFGQNLVWAKCSQVNAAGDNMYTEATNKCSSGSAGTMRYCSPADNSCNGGTNTGTLDGGGMSQIWDSCAALNTGGRTDWRVPTAGELGFFLFHVYRFNSTLFDGVPAQPEYWSSTSLAATDAHAFNAALTGSPSRTKTNTNSLRCVADL